MEIHPPARRPAGTASVMPTSSTPSNTPLAVEDAGEDPDRWLVIGPDTAANLLEVVVLVSSEGDQQVIHAMAMRPTYRRLLKR